MKKAISTKKAPAAIGTYSQAVQHGQTVYVSGQIGLDPETMEMAPDFDVQAHQVFNNLSAVVEAAGGSLDQILKLTVYLVDLSQFTKLNTIMATYFTEPYPARAALEVSALPRGALIEIDAVMGI